VAFKTKLLNLAKKQIQGWHLPDRILDEVSLFLIRILPSDIEHNLMRVNEPFQGMVAECARRDHHVIGRDHHFVFLVYFADDEQTLYVARGHYQMVDL
jgi:hypothetical protein